MYVGTADVFRSGKDAVSSAGKPTKRMQQTQAQVDEVCVSHVLWLGLIGTRVLPPHCTTTIWQCQYSEVHSTYWYHSTMVLPHDTGSWQQCSWTSAFEMGCFVTLLNSQSWSPLTIHMTQN